MAASLETLMRQAPMTVEEYLRGVVAAVDRVFGADYARKNPALVGELVRCCALDFAAMATQQALTEAAGGVARALEEVAGALDRK